MLAGLILCGVAFEYRHRAQRTRWLWDACFAGGSLVAAFMQGVMVGALVEGVRGADNRYAGGVMALVPPLVARVGCCANVKPTFATRPIALSHICRWRCSSS